MLTPTGTREEQDALKWAARTYVVALGSIATYTIFRLYGRKQEVEKKML
jgi:hypothetical protein